MKLLKGINMQYLEQIEELIRDNLIEVKYSEYKVNNTLVNNYWNIGKLLVEVQKYKRAEYGENLLRKWANYLSDKYGKGYDYSNLKRFRNFYSRFQKGGALPHQLSWTNICLLLPFKDNNEFNYYYN